MPRWFFPWVSASPTPAMQKRPTPVQVVLLRLHRELYRESSVATDTLSRLSMMPTDVGAFHPALELMASVRKTVHDHLSLTDPETALRLLTEVDLAVRRDLCGEAGKNCYPRGTLARMVDCLARAAAALRELAHPLTRPDVIPAARTSVVVPTDLLFHAHRVLFPAERMVVVAGERTHAIRLGAMFDVTGPHEESHVRADQSCLAHALIAMQKAGRHLAAWGHSHPGRGAIATTPSSTDRRQHAAWIQHYGKDLLSFIVVEDGFLRFFGTALEEHRITLDMTGTGIQKENSHAHLYRLDV